MLVKGSLFRSDFNRVGGRTASAKRDPQRFVPAVVTRVQGEEV
jgi:hypothetical protein